MPPLSVEIDYTASTRTVECTLDGEHDDMLLEDCGQLQEVMTHFADNMERDAEEDTIRDGVTVKEFIEKFKNWDETTSTSLSGFNLSHCLLQLSVVFQQHVVALSVQHTFCCPCLCSAICFH